MISLWEQRSFTDYDVIIVGAGISGLSTAASLIEQDPKLSILVLERGILPTGASTKNAGFACFGSLTELMEDLKVLGEDGTKALVTKRWEGLQKTRSRLGDDRIGYLQKGGYELLFDNTSYQEELAKVNALLQPLFEEDVFTDKSQHLNKFGFGKAKQLLYNQLEGQLDTGKLMDSLWRYCMHKGVKIITGAMVTSLEANKVTVNTRYGFSAKAVIVCTNAFTNALISVDENEPIRPGRGMVLAIKPSVPLPFEGTFHYEQGYYYFRDYEELLLFGGGRNLAYDEEQTTLFEINQTIKAKLIEDIHQTIIPGTAYEIVHEWSGIMAFGLTKSPIVKKHASGVYMGVRLGGMGVAIGSKVGEELASLVIADGL
ncbi:MAG: glycine/D-amino acid oxidase-like deaminating enzyme [Cyclobacteriaceae bacterium]|jgi:glycine/D-amino acid oxidase-like deaminating enzyme